MRRLATFGVTASLFVALGGAGGTSAALRGVTCSGRGGFPPSATDPSWSPHGGKVAFTWRDSDGARVEVWDSRQGRRALIAAGFQPAWSPDGRELAYADWVLIGPAPSGDCGPLGQSDLFVSAPGGTAVDVTSTMQQSESYPSWSPDGSQIAFAFFANDGYGLGILDLATRRERVLVGARDALGRLLAGPAWSPDGRRLAFIAGDHIDIVNRDGTGLRQLPPLSNLFPQSLSWSPDGRRIALSAARHYYESGLFVMNSDGTGRRRVTRGYDSEPAWSPDGRALVFVRLARRRDFSSGTRLYVIATNGRGHARRLF